MMEHTDSARTVNPAHGSGGGFISIVMAAGGGWLPPPGSGLVTAKVLAMLLGVNEDTIRNWVAKYQIPYRKPGAAMLIDPADLIPRLPFIGGDTPES